LNKLFVASLKLDCSTNILWKRVSLPLKVDLKNQKYNLKSPVPGKCFSKFVNMLFVSFLSSLNQYTRWYLVFLIAMQFFYFCIIRLIYLIYHLWTKCSLPSYLIWCEFRRIWKWIYFYHKSCFFFLNLACRTSINQNQ
jgi:hypothetical protein